MSVTIFSRNLSYEMFSPGESQNDKFSPEVILSYTLSGINKCINKMAALRPHLI